jgi:hypothetical protein
MSEEPRNVDPTLEVVKAATADYRAVRSDSQVAVMSSEANAAVKGCKIQQVGTIFVGAAGIFGESRGFNALIGWIVPETAKPERTAASTGRPARGVCFRSAIAERRANGLHPARRESQIRACDPPNAPARDWRHSRKRLTGPGPQRQQHEQRSAYIANEHSPERHHRYSQALIRIWRELD